MPTTSKKTQIRKPEAAKPDFTLRDDDPVPMDDDEGEPKEEPARELKPAKKELNIQGPFATKRQFLDLLNRTKDGKLIFQGLTDGEIVTVDTEGYRIPRKLDSKQLVFNSTPDDLRRQRARNKLALGEVIYCVRPMSRGRKVYAARVEGFDARGVMLTVLGATGEAKFNRRRVVGDGTIIYPYRYCFKEAVQVQTYLDDFRDDFARSQTDFRRLLEQGRKG